MSKSKVQVVFKGVTGSMKEYTHALINHRKVGEYNVTFHNLKNSSTKEYVENIAATTPGCSLQEINTKEDRGSK